MPDHWGYKLCTVRDVLAWIATTSPLCCQRQVSSGNACLQSSPCRRQLRLKPLHAQNPCCCLTQSEVAIVLFIRVSFCSMPPRRSARLAAQKAPLETISLDDGDTDNLVSANFDCADCGESGASIHTPLCNYATHKGCNDDGVDAPCVFCQRTCAIW